MALVDATTTAPQGGELEFCSALGSVFVSNTKVKVQSSNPAGNTSKLSIGLFNFENKFRIKVIRLQAQSVLF